MLSFRRSSRSAGRDPTRRMASPFSSPVAGEAERTLHSCSRSLQRKVTPAEGALKRRTSASTNRAKKRTPPPQARAPRRVNILPLIIPESAPSPRPCPPRGRGGRKAGRTPARRPVPASDGRIASAVGVAPHAHLAPGVEPQALLLARAPGGLVGGEHPGLVRIVARGADDHPVVERELDPQPLGSRLHRLEHLFRRL